MTKLSSVLVAAALLTGCSHKRAELDQWQKNSSQKFRLKATEDNISFIAINPFVTWRLGDKEFRARIERDLPERELFSTDFMMKGTEYEPQLRDEHDTHSPIMVAGSMARIPVCLSSDADEHHVYVRCGLIPLNAYRRDLDATEVK